jgi:hypothetical protein
MFQVLNKVTDGKSRATRRSSGGRRVILKALRNGVIPPHFQSFSVSARHVPKCRIFTWI